MELIPSAYFCTTPYQIITAIVMHQVLREKSDIYIIPQFSLAEKYADNLRKLGIFRRVKLVDTEAVEQHKKANSKWKMHIGIALQYLHVQKIGERILFADTRYQRFYASSKAYVPRMAYFYCLKNRIETELIYYDDGEGSYYFRERIEPSKADRIARSLTIGKKSLESPTKLYLYDPELYRKINCDYWKGDIIPIPHIINEQNVKKILSQVFEITDEDIIIEKAIIIDVLKQDRYSEDNIGRLNSLYCDLRDLFGAENTVIKKHPRDTSEGISGCRYYKNNNMPFECLCTQVNMNEKVIIGTFSTAVIIPKILLGQEPTVILLYRLFKRLNQSEEARKKQDQFYTLLKDSYSSKNKFFIPGSFEELQEALRIAAQR